MITLFRGCWLVLSTLLLVSQTAPRVAAHGNEGGDIMAATTCNIVVSNLIPFVDRLPIPATIRPARTNLNYRVPVATNLFYASIPEYDVPMTSIMHQFHRDLPPVEVWGYAGAYPGPTFDVRKDQPILVNWINNLPATYPSWMPIDTNFHGIPDRSVRTVVHLHGGTTLPRYDGFPENWFRTGQSDQYFYGNIDPDGDGQTLWYHDHAIGVTANNVYAGLAGFYLLRNPAVEDPLKLPKIPYEIPLVFQDRDIQTNCSPASLYFGPISWYSLPVVNGKVTPYLEVEPRPYRFRILNGSAFRTYGLAMTVTDRAGIPVPGAKLAPFFNMIGTDDGFLAKTVNVNPTNMVPMMSGERVDLIIDFTQFAGTNITMTNLIGLGNVPFPPYISNLMQFRVTLPFNTDTNIAPVVFVPTNLVPEAHSITGLLAKVVRTREFALDMFDQSPFPGAPFTLGSSYPRALINLKYFHDPVTEMPHAGDTEIWSVVNLTSEAHPFHVHLTDFRVIDRIRFAGWNTNNDLAFPPTAVTNYVNDRIANNLKPLSTYLSVNTNDVFLARQFENGPKDTVRAAPFSVTRIIMTWPTNSFYYETITSDMGEHAMPGTYVFHCHILDHEDNDMMRPFQILPPYQPTLQAIRDATVNPAGNNHFRLSFDTRLNESYRVQTTPGLSPPSWINSLSVISGTGATVELNPASALDPTRFYRVERLLAP